MVNRSFMTSQPIAYGIFLPFLISNHSHGVLVIPKGVKSQKKSFRFANFVANMKNFLPIVAEGD